ncbi:quercetin dioxygenase-like cupin family protein [Bradyrhizobium sp. USDA 4506]
MTISDAGRPLAGSRSGKSRRLEFKMTSKLMKATRLLARTALFNASLLTIPSAQAQQPTGFTRTDLQRHDLSVGGHEAVQVRVDIAPGKAFGRHTHPGEEIIYVLAGTLEYDVDGRPPARLKAGDVLFIPAGTVHAARNVGDVTASELATYIVEKDKPLLTLVK